MILRRAEQLEGKVGVAIDVQVALTVEQIRGTGCFE